MGKKKNKKTMLIATLLAICMLPALALLKTSVFGKEKNAIITDNTARYDIVADLDGGKFELGTKPEFTKMDNGKWLHKYKPTMLPTKIPKPVKDGYTFVGWTLEGETTPKPEYSIPSWNKKNINLKANWSAADSVLLPGPSFNSALRYSDNYKNINHIKFIKGYPDPNGIDLSEKQDKSIMGSFKDGIFTIACEGKILANPDSSEMFRANMYTSEITFDNFDTTNVINMENMFYVHSTRDSYASLRKINGINKFNTSNVTNMTGMFSGCSRVESLDVSSFDTSKVISMCRMFEGCETIKTLDVSNFDTSNVEDMSSIFAVRWSGSKLENRNKPANLTEIIGLERFNTSNVWNMQEMFSGCTNTINLNVSKFDTSKVVFMQGMFNGCWSLASIDVSNFNTSNVTNMSYMFKECSKLKTIDVSNFNTLKVTDMCGMFSTGKAFDIYMMDPNFHKDSALKSIIGFENLDTSKVTNMRDMFIGDMNLNQINLKNLNMSNVKDTSYMFGGCAKLSGEITIDNFKVTNYDGMFWGCASGPNTEFWVKWKTPEDKELGRKMVNTKCEGENHVYLWEPSSTLKQGTIFYRDVMHFIPGATTATEIKFIKATPDPNGLDLSEKQDKSIMGVVRNNVIEIACAGEMYANPFSDSMFSMYGHPDGINTELDKITFENFNTSKVVTMAGMFADCYKLKQIDLSGFNTTNVKDMSCMFSGCKSLETLDVSNLNTSNVTNMFGMFRLDGSKVAVDLTNPTKLHEIVGLDRFDTSNVTNMSRMFEHCDNIISLNVSSFNTSNVTDMSGMFKECSKLKSIDVSNFNTSKVTNMSEMFSTGRLTTGLIIDGSHNLRDIESNLKSIVGLDKFDMSKVTNTSKMFEDNIKLSGELTVDNFKVTDYTDMFIGCSQDANAEFLVKWKSPEDKELARKMVETKNPSDHVYLYESSVLVSGPEFNNLLKTHFQNNGNKIKTVKFVKDTPKSNGVDFSDKNDKTIMGNLENDILTIRCATQIEANPDCSNMFNAFYNSYMPNFGIGGIEFSNFYTQNVVNMESMFESLYFDSIDLSKFNTARVTNMSNMFNFTSFANLDLTSFDTTRVTNMSGMFESNENLKAINLSSFDVKNVTDMSGMFSGCHTLYELNLKNFNTQRVRSTKAMFSGCESLTDLDLHNFSTNNVTDISYMFGACYKLQNLDVSGFDTSNVVNMRSVFDHCEKLTALDLSKWDTRNVKYMNNMFDYCLDLKTIGENNFDFRNVKDMSYMFQSCNNLTGKITFNFPDIPLDGGFTPNVSCKSMFNSCSINSETPFMLDYINNYSRFVAENVYGLGNVRIRDRYRVTYDFDGGSFMSGEKNNHYYSYEGLVLEIPYKYGYRFIGWTGSNGSVPQDNIEIQKGEMGDRHYIANWEPIHSGPESPNPFKRSKSTRKPQNKTVNITLNNGPSAMYPVQKIQTKAGNIGELPKPDLNPKYAGQFGGYYYDKNCTIPVKPNDIVTQDIELYAKW